MTSSPFTTSRHADRPNDFVDGSGLSSQQWWQVIAPPTELADRCRRLLPHDSVLETGELQLLAATIASDEGLWRPLVVEDRDRRRYRLLLETESVDIWVLSWMPDQATGYHDHDRSSVGLACAHGTVVERQLLLPRGATSLELQPGCSRHGGPGYIHSVQHLQGEPAVTVHAYSPRLTAVGQYRVDDAGVLQRSVEHGRQELIDHTIARIDPERA